MSMYVCVAEMIGICWDILLTMECAGGASVPSVKTRYMNKYTMLYAWLGFAVFWIGAASLFFWIIQKAATFDYCPLYYGVKCLL